MKREFGDGVRMLVEGDPREALAVFEPLAKTANTDGRRADALYNIAVCHLRLGSKPDALAAISDAVRADPQLADEIRSDPDFSTFAGNPWFDRALTGVIRAAGPVSAEAPLKRELTKLVWTSLVPAMLLMVAAGVADASGLPTLVTLGLVVFVVIAVPLSLHSLWHGDVTGAKAAVAGAAELGGWIVVLLIGVIAFALILTALGF